MWVRVWADIVDRHWVEWSGVSISVCCQIPHCATAWTFFDCGAEKAHTYAALTRQITLPRLSSEMQCRLHHLNAMLRYWKAYTALGYGVLSPISLCRKLPENFYILLKGCAITKLYLRSHRYISLHGLFRLLGQFERNCHASGDIKPIFY